MESAALVDVVREVTADAIGIELEAVGSDSNLTDLGAQSLELLDIVFKLEQRYDIEITRGEMERAARGDMDDEAFAPDGVVSEAGLARLAELMPESASRIRPGLRVSQILTLFSVTTFARIVERKLGERPA